MMRTLLGFVVAPLVPGTLFALLDALSGHPSMAPWYIRFSALAGYPIAIILGVPLYFLLRKIGRTGVWYYIAGGVILGIVALSLPFFEQGLLVGAGEMYQMMRTAAAAFLPLSAACGAVAAFSFWLIARPDRS